MTRAIIVALTCCSIASLAIAADTSSKKAATPVQKAPATTAQTKKVAPPPTTASKAPAKPQGTARATTGGTASRTPNRTATAYRRNTYRAPVRRSYAPQQPTSDRYREIQDALVAKGYLQTQPSGVWDKDSLDAMQRFQQDQKLEPTGKLTARSLVALGLGPKSPATTVVPANGGPGGTSSGDALPAQ